MLGDGTWSIVNSSLSKKKTAVGCCFGILSMTVSRRFGLLAYHLVSSSTWLVCVMVDCGELSLNSSLLKGLTHEISSRLSSTVWLGDVAQ